MGIKITPTTAKQAAAVSPELSQLFERIPVRDLANKLQTDEDTAQQALSAALPALLAKLQDNASTAEGASSLASALQRHNNCLASNTVNLNDVDTVDGGNILRHVFGEDQPRVAQQLADSTSGASKGLLESLLPMLAPIAMSFLSNQLSGGNQTRNLQQGQDSGFDLGGLLGGLLGGRQASQQGQTGGFDVGGLLEGLFGKR